MSRLYDSVVHKSNPDRDTQSCLGDDDRWYIAKPVAGPFLWGFWGRLKDAWRVLVGRAFAVHYAQDSRQEYWK